MASGPEPSVVTAPEPIPDFIRKTLNLREEGDPALVQLANDEGAILVCAIAPYRSMRVSPIEVVRASIGLHEEFAFEALIDEILNRNVARKKMMVLLNSPGGGMHSSFKVARALRKTFEDIEIYVPHIAASGATLIALTANKIVMGLMSQLSPLDPQVMYRTRQISALVFRHAYDRVCTMFEKKTKDEAPYPQQVLANKLDPFLMEDWNSAIETAEQYAFEILRLAKYPEDLASKLARTLVLEFPDHDSDIDYETAARNGIRVEKYDASARNKKVWRLFRAWLGKFLFEESATHVIRYVLPRQSEGNEQAA